ncbi:hypothetical protein LOTGIDRAFT_161025 [Lottia gigantea]|uniref:Uncharacterized protein n=1 Tax=Lottia gigantea TaxID=225164 RepID=V4AHU5_LOTGI|nr:hypothetical protein LOTGIDRAFT_161025 [Lottia gigantea]ESO94775.1 hypothetical protein LOTGIDRAFT_161025 [Lottia gigantea]
MANKILDPICRLYDPIRYSFNKKKEDYIIISPTVGSKFQLNDGGRISFEINSLSNWLLLSDAYFRCDFKIKDGTPNENRVPQTNTTLENNFFPSLFSEMVLEADSNPIQTIKHPGEFDTMLKTVFYPKDFDSVSGWIPDVGDGSVLKEPVGNLANDADLARVRVVARNTIERVARAANHGFENRVLQYNKVVENKRKVSIGLPYKIHLQREINDNKIFFGEIGSDAKLEITNLQLFIPVITPSIEVETRIFNSLTKDIEIAFLHRNTVGSMTLTGESTTWPITNTIKPARYILVGFKNLADSQTNNNNVFRVAMNQTQDRIIPKVQRRMQLLEEYLPQSKLPTQRKQLMLKPLKNVAKGLGVGDMIGTIKEFGKRFGEETKKTVKQGLNKLVDSIDTGEVKVKHKEIFPNNSMFMCICGSSGSGKTHLTFNMLTTPNLLDFDSLYIYTTTPELSYYQFLKALEYLPKKDVQDLFQYYEENEEEVEIKDIIDN